MAVKVSLEKLLEVGAHFGHQTKRWNPKMRDYIHGAEGGVHLFDLLKTKEALDEALALTTSTVKEEKLVLVLGSKKQVKDRVKKLGENTKSFVVTERWLGGTLTNFEQITKSLTKLTEMKEKKASGGFSEFTKKERLLLDREIDRLERFFGGMVGMNKVPDLLIVVDTKREFAAVREARKAKVPCIGIVDSNSDPTMVDYPIPMNDDATKALSYVIGLFERAIIEGQKKTKTKSKK